MNKLEEAALRYHEDRRPGKIEVIPTKPHTKQEDLSLAYSPGVAYPCLEIEKQPMDAYKYTNKGNLVAVISNGTAVLGLGNIGAAASKPVMEGKALLFKIFAGIDSFDIEVDEEDPEKFISTVRAISKTFGGINLEDNQHGTAIISGAALLNALEIQGKKIEDIKLVVNGAGAAAISCTNHYIRLGVKRENVVMCDSKGVIREDRTDINEHKRQFVTKRDLHTLAEAIKDADVFLGLSVADSLTPAMVLEMAPRPIIFALANPNPEIDYQLALATRDDLIMATGRSDYPNQVNNVLGFPYIFRGALDCHANSITEEMKLAATYAIAALAKEPVPQSVLKVYNLESLEFGRDYILPKPFDPRLLYTVSPAVAKGAMESGVAESPITDWEEYDRFLRTLLKR